MEDRQKMRPGRSWRRLLAVSAFLALALPTTAYTPDTPSTFTLRHIFHRGTYRDPKLHKRLDIHPSTTEFVTAYEDEVPEVAPPPRLPVRSKPINIERLVDRRRIKIQEHLDYASLTGEPRILDVDQWTTDELSGPNVTDKDTVISLAIIAANAYIPNEGEAEWEDVGQGWNESTKFGWEGDGLRGHIFADEKNETVIVGLKGTSPAVFDGDGTTTRDKLNDNLFFGCCCGQGGQFFWRQVCSCQTSTYTCNSTCLVKALKDKTRYYSAAIDLYTNVTELYPDSNIWIVGHSLGGAVSSLLGLTFGLPVVTYEAPGDDLPAKRLGLPHPRVANPNNPYRRQYTGAHHFGHTADPIFMGACNAATSPCTLGGYAMESQCHTGTQCVYDTVGDHGWRLGLGYHRIHDVIDNVLRKYDKVPECIPDKECVDCYNWKFFESNGSDTKTSTTMTKTTMTSRTRTQTCETPGWWGCLDKTTTSSSSTPIITTTYTTTTCLTPGWFGCKVEANATITTTTAISRTTHVPATTTATTTAVETTTDCESWGWFGCDDPETYTHTHTHTKAPKTTSTTTTSSEVRTTCKTPGLFFGCRDRHTHTIPDWETQTGVTSIPKTSSSILSSISSPPPPSSPPTKPTTKSKTRKPTPSPTETNPSPPHKEKCKHTIFFGLICVDSKSGSSKDGEGLGQGKNYNDDDAASPLSVMSSVASRETQTQTRERGKAEWQDEWQSEL